MAGKVTTQLVIEGRNNSKAAFDQVNRQLGDMNKSLSQSAKLFTGVLAGGGALSFGRELLKQTDDFKLMNARLQLATDSQQQFNTAQQELRRISKASNAPLESLVSLYGRISRPLKEAGRSQADILKITEAVSASFRVSGATAVEAENGVIQFAQALGTGALRGDEFNSVAEQAPRLMQALADGIGVPTSALKNMAAQGQLTASVVTNALIGQLPKLTEELNKLPKTFDASVNNFNTQLSQAIGKLDRLTGASSAAIDSVDRISDTIEGVSDSAEPGWFSSFFETMKLANSRKIFDAAFNFLVFGPKSLDRSAAEQIAAAERVAREMNAIEEARIEASLANERNYVASLKSIRDQQVTELQKRIASEESLQKQGNEKFESLLKNRAEIQKKYAAIYAELDGGQSGGGNFLDASGLKYAAQQSLNSGNIERSKAEVEAAISILRELKSAGQNTYGFKGLAQELEAIEQAINEKEIEQVQTKNAEVGAQLIKLKSDAEQLKKLDIGLNLPPEELEAVKAKLQELANTPVFIPIKLQPTNEMSAMAMQAAPLALSQFATGGRVSGPGSGTSDSILARLSNGEYVLRAAAVRHYGTNLLDKLNGLNVPKFATGGLVDAAMSSPGSQPGRDLGRVDLHAGGETIVLYGDSNSMDQINRRNALKFGRTSRGK